MALVAAAVCPHPPLLIPEVGRGVELAARDAAREAARRLVAADPDRVVLVGADGDSARYAERSRGSFARFGVDVEVSLGPGPGGGDPVLPLSLSVGAWLLAGTGWSGPREALGVPDALSPQQATDLGAEIAAAEARVALLCLGDGSARRTEKAPGWLDPRAEPFDRAVAEALATADARTLASLDPELACELLVAGRASWQVLAGAALGQSWSAELLADEAPFGVGYFVAGWEPAPRPAAVPA